MAADEKGAGSEDPTRAAPGVPLSPKSPQSEWTASDRRGPLDSAEEDDVERMVPAHEIDAEGGADPGAPVAAADAPPSTAPHEPMPADDAVPLRAETPASEALSPSASTAAEAPRRSLVPVAASLVIGALVGAGSAWLVYAAAPHGGDNGAVAALSARVDALEKRPDPGASLGTLRAALADVQGKVAALEAQKPEPKGANAVAAVPARPDAGLAAKVAALQSALTDLQNRPRAPADDGAAAAKVASLQKEVDASRKQAADARAALDGVKNEQQQLGAKVAALGTTVSGTLDKIQGAQKQAADAKAGLDAVQGRQAALEGKLGSPALAVVADSLVEQVRAGQPFGRQVDALASLGVDPAKVAVLREKAGGVASAQTLLAEWKPLENAVIAAGTKAPADAGFGQRLEHGLFGLVSVRRADGTVGDDVGARVTAIAAALAHGDVAGASATWQALPPDAKTRSEAWGAKATASAATMATAHDLQQGAIEALAGKTP